MEGPGTDLTNIFYAFTLLMLLLSVGVVIFVVIYQRRVMQQRIQMKDDRVRYQQELLETSYTSQEKERERIAKDLHDEVGAMLSAVKMSIHLAERRLKAQGVADEGLSESRGLIESVIGGVRQISHDLMPPSLEKLGLVPALREFFRKMGKASGLEFKFSAPDSVPRMPPSLELGLYRIVQESVNNALKHGDASAIECKLSLNEKELEMTVGDNGKGFDLSEARNRGGLGLKSLTSRAEAIGGKLKIDSAPGKGTMIGIKIL